MSIKLQNTLLVLVALIALCAAALELHLSAVVGAIALAVFGLYFFFTSRGYDQEQEYAQ